MSETELHYMNVLIKMDLPFKIVSEHGSRGSMCSRLHIFYKALYQTITCTFTFFTHRPCVLRYAVVVSNMEMG